MKRYSIEEKEGYWIIKNENGATLGISDLSILLEQDGWAFKDLNRNGVLDPYEDWRLPMEERVSDLVQRMPIEKIGGLMLYSIQQVVSQFDPFAVMTPYGGTGEQAKRENIWDLNEQLKHLLRDEKMRHITLATVDSAEAAARWNNNLQAFAEALDFGIPVNISSDPRHTPTTKKAEFNMGAADYLSTWPENLGLAATFSPEITREFGKIGSKEYRAMGITTALSPQIDLATEPRWNRVYGTFGESPQLATDMARAYCDGFQTSEGDAETSRGWGFDSVNAMVKHWPGGGTCEGGRDAHFAYGKYGVYPGDNLEEQLKPFVEGAFNLEGDTKEASAVMPYYTISYDQDKQYGENVGNSYSKYIITDLLRNKYGYDGVVCTDWGVTSDAGSTIDTIMTGKCWGTEDLSVVERHYKVLMAGVDQFGGNNDLAPLMKAYDLGVAEHGEEAMRERFEQSGRRLLRNIFRTGLFENPYLDAQETIRTVGCKEFNEKGREAQRKSVVLLKNKGNLLPIKARTKVYIPEKVQPAGVDWFGQPTPEHRYPSIAAEIVNKYFELVEQPEKAEVAFVFMDSPLSPAYHNGYVPINLQYRPHTAADSRETSIAGGDRSIKGASTTTNNEVDLDVLLETKEKMGDKPVIVFLTLANPTVPAEFEPYSDAIVADFGIEKEILLEAASGIFEPSGLLPCQLPANMKTVDKQKEDVPFDMEPYADECGNIYDFAFGLNWNGKIQDERVRKYGLHDLPSNE